MVLAILDKFDIIHPIQLSTKIVTRLLATNDHFLHHPSYNNQYQHYYTSHMTQGTPLIKVYNKYSEK